VSTTGACTPGSRQSPDLSTIAAFGSAPQYAVGTVGSKGWLLTVQSNAAGDSWQLDFADQTVSQTLSCLGDVASANASGPDSAEIRISSNLRGDRFAVGYVPSWVTSVTANARGRSVSEPVLRGRLAGHRYFVLYLGSRQGLCDSLCTGSVTLNFVGANSARASTLFRFGDSRTGTPSSGIEFATDQLSGSAVAG
jgi:hypothetical protein